MNAGNQVDTALQACDHVLRRYMTLGQGLEINLDASAVQRAVGTIGADKRGQAGDIPIFQNRFTELRLLARHGRERDRIGSLRYSLDDARVLGWKEAFGNLNVLGESKQQHCRSHTQSRGLMLEGPREAASVGRDDALEAGFGPAIEAALLPLRGMPQQARTHHRGQAQGHHGGDHDGDTESDGELAEQAPDDIAHEQQRNQDGH